MRLDDLRVSLEHAAVRWQNGRWELRDLGSRNGTRVESILLKPGTQMVLRQGMLLHFGSLSQSWELVEDSEPDIVAQCLETGELRCGREGYLSLADARLFTEDGKQYVLDEAGQQVQIRDRDVVHTGQMRWRVSIPPPTDDSSGTISAEGLLWAREVTLRFAESLDGEHVSVQLVAPGIRRQLKYRSFDHMMMALARARRDDALNSSLPVSEHGWLFADELAEGLGLDPTHLNAHVYRARARLAKEGIHDVSQAIERRASTGMIRLGTGGVEVIEPRG